MKNKRLGFFLPLLLILTLAAVALRTSALFLDFNFDIGYFDRHTLFTVSAVCIAVTVFVMLSYLVLGAPRKPRASFSTPATYITSGAVGCALLFVVAELLHRVFIYSAPLFKDGRPTDIGVLLALICAILALGTVAYFFLNAYLAARRSEMRAYFSLFAAVFFALYATMLYFDAKTPINSPSKLVDQAALLFSALFLLFEARISLGRERVGAYFSFGLGAAALTAYSSLPTLIVYIVLGECVSDALPTAVMLFALFIFILARLILLSRSPENEPSRAALNMEAYAEARAEDVANRSAEYERLYTAEQISIDSIITDAKDEAETVEEDSEDSSEKQTENGEVNEEDTCN